MSKTILITGTSTGFGHLMATTLSAEGHKVYASMRSPSGKNRDHAHTLEAAGISVIELDVTNNDSVQRAVNHIVEQAGKIDVLVNNAGIASAGVSEAFSDQQLKDLFDVNVFGVQRLSRAVLPAMRARGEGLVINIGSILGRVTFPFFGLYGASKYALEAITDSYRYELSKFGVDAVLVQPSAYPTSMYSSVQTPVDASCTSSYGEVGEIPNAMFAHFMSMFEAQDAPNPADVAQTVSTIINTENGKRPDRAIVGADFGSAAINDATAPIQTQTVQALGLGDLIK